MNSLFEASAIGIATTYIVEFLKYQKWFPVKYDDTQRIRIVTALLSVLSVAGYWHLTVGLNISDMQTFQSFASDVAMVYGASVVSYYGVVKPSDKQKNKQIYHFMNQ